MTGHRFARHILHVIDPAPHGGAETVVRALAGGALRRGDAPLVAALAHGREKAPLVAQLRADGVALREIRCGRRRYLAEIGAVEAAITDHGAQVVHTHVYHADLVGYFAARRRGVPLIATVHGYAGGDWKNRFYEWLDLTVLRRFDAVLCVSESVAARVRRAGASAARVRVVPNAFVGGNALDRAAARRELGVPTGARIIGWIGRLSAEKGPDRFVDAVRPLVGEQTLAALVGDGPERKVLASLIGPGARAIRLLGSRADAGTLVSAFDVLAITSRTEGLPMTLLEAMAARVPVVSFAVGGIPDVVDEGSAWLVPPGDVAAFRGALVRALTEGAEAGRRAAEAARVCEQRFGMEQWLDRVYGVYDEVVR